METVNISEFRSNLLKYLEKVENGQQITVTTNGRVLATLIPPVQKREVARKQLQELAASAKVGDVSSPVESDWDVMS